MLSNQFEIKSDGTKKKVSPKKKFEIKSHGTKFVREVKIVLANKKKKKKKKKKREVKIVAFTASWS